MKMSDIAIDPVAIDKGDWVPIPFSDMAGVSILTRGTLCPGYRKTYDQLLNEAIRALPPGEEQLSTEATEAIDAQALLAECLMDWKGIENDDETPMSFTVEAATTYMTKREYRKFFLAARYAAQKVGQTVKKQTDKIAGN